MWKILLPIAAATPALLIALYAQRQELRRARLLAETYKAWYERLRATYLHPPS